MSTISLGLRIGPGRPDLAPGYLMRALRAVEVTQQDSAPCGFQLSFLAELVAAGNAFTIVDDPLLAPFNRVLVRAAVNGVATTLIDGFITHHQYVPGNGPADTMFVVTGQDVSVKMDLIDYSREFPALPDAAAALVVLAPWLALGIFPEVVPSLNTIVPIEYVPQQAETDRKLLQRLAQKNGNLFYISPGDGLFENTAYWGPPKRAGSPSALIDVAVGPASTANSFTAEYDALAPETYFGLSIETLIEPFLPLPVVTLESSRYPPLAARPALDADAGLLAVRRTLWRDDQADPVTANLQAQALTDVSSDAVVQVNCEVTPATLGTIVCAPGLVGVRGTGEAYDGIYYLKSATHRVSLLAQQGWDYTEQLTMSREGVGTTTSTLEVS